MDGAAAYVYDGEGQRVRKLLGENLRFVYGIGGGLIAEFDGASGALKKEYVYRASGLAATIEPGVGTRYVTADHLGSPRIITGANGAVISRHDYQPFGEELFVGMGGRTIAQGYGVADGLRKQFTSKERDNETGLDYFLARYYSSMQGRFTSPDEFTGGPDELFDFADDAADNPTFYAELTNPQSLNKYQYAYNNPSSVVDPDGHRADTPDPQGNCCDGTGTQGTPIPVPPTYVSPQQAQQTVDAISRGLDAIFEPVRRTETTTVIRQLIGTEAIPEVSPDAIPPVPLPQTGTPPSQQSQPLPPPPPVQAKVNKVKPVPGAVGPHSVPKRDPRTGKVTGYTQFGPNGAPVKRYRGQGKPHGGVRPPLVVEPRKPGGRPNRARPARSDEIPK